jgi:pimeloyl-ACP methyl ester carboxylesterase
VAASALLIHGAWQGPWAWDAFIPPFAAKGWRCRAIDLPENGQPGAGEGLAGRRCSRLEQNRNIDAM